MTHMATLTIIIIISIFPGLLSREQINRQACFTVSIWEIEATPLTSSQAKAQNMDDLVHKC